MSFNYSHSTFRDARERAFTRSNGVCQFCGLAPAEQGHHWAIRYP